MSELGHNGDTAGTQLRHNWGIEHMARLRSLPSTLSLLAFAALCGCAVGPDYQVPKPELPAQWLEAKGSEQTANLERWWTGLKDPQLDALIQRAESGSFDLKLALSRLRQSRAEHGIADLQWQPSLDASAGVTRSGGARPPVNSFRTGLDANWELDIWGAARRGEEAAAAEVLAATEDVNAVRLALRAEVALQYLNLRNRQLQLDIAKRNVEAQQRSVEITRKRQQAGFIAGLDVANAEAQVANTDAQIPGFEKDIDQSCYTLATLLGVSPASLVAELKVAAPMPASTFEVPLELPASLLRRRPDIRRAEARLQGASARIGVATADLFPRLMLKGSVGLQSSEAAHLTDGASRFWSFGPSLSLPLFNRDAIRFNIEVRNAQEEQARLSYQSSVIGALSETESALSALRQELEHQRRLDKALVLIIKAEDLAKQLYANGQTDFLNVLSAQRSRFSAEAALASSRMNCASAWIAVHKALGGGWEAETK